MLEKCPVCDIDVVMFEAPELRNHLQQHVDDANNKIFQYIHKNFSDVPKGLLELWLDRNEVIKETLPYLNEIAVQ
tara:strand:+ start:1422 stop:1646 length:225 start_codon:yes stop_codon:yes gene_type:complete